MVNQYVVLFLFWRSCGQKIFRIPMWSLPVSMSYIIDCYGRVWLRKVLRNHLPDIKGYYNMKTMNISFKACNKALVFLPTGNNKSLLQWKGSFVVTKKSKRVDYQLDVQGKLKTFHINSLKVCWKIYFRCWYEKGRECTWLGECISGWLRMKVRNDR